MNESSDHLYYSDLDKNLTVWGFATNDGVRATGFGDDAVGDCYYHPDLGWTYAATGRPVARDELERDE